MQNDRTPFLNLPLPFASNNLVDDVERLRQALSAIDDFARTGNAATATKLATARKINGQDFDGTGDITITAAASGGTSAACSGNAATATKLVTARKINGQDFDGTSDITITAAASGGTSAACSGNAATATKLATARKINGQDFDGTSDITITDSTKLPSGGTAAAATKLATARKINGQDFDGTSDITIPTNDASKLPLAGGILTGTANATSTDTGALQIRGGLGVTNDIYAGGNITAFSDERLKRDIREIDRPLDRMARVRGITYTDIATGERRTGVVAQDLLKVIPEAVTRKGEHFAVAYGNLFGLAAASINELAREVESIKRKLR